MLRINEIRDNCFKTMMETRKQRFNLIMYYYNRIYNDLDCDSFLYEDYFDNFFDSNINNKVDKGIIINRLILPSC